MWGQTRVEMSSSRYFQWLVAGFCFFSRSIHAQNEELLGSACLGTTEFAMYDDIKTGFDFFAFCPTTNGIAARISNQAEFDFIHDLAITLNRERANFFIGLRDFKNNAGNLATRFTWVDGSTEGLDFFRTLNQFPWEIDQPDDFNQDCVVWTMDANTWDDRVCDSERRYICRIDNSLNCQEPEVTNVPTDSPTSLPTSAPSTQPTFSPTFQPTIAPSSSPTGVPVPRPTIVPSSLPTGSPKRVPPTASQSGGDSLSIGFRIGFALGFLLILAFIGLAVFNYRREVAEIKELKMRLTTLKRFASSRGLTATGLPQATSSKLKGRLTNMREQQGNLTL